MLVTAHSLITIVLRLSGAAAPSAADLAAFGVFLADDWPAQHVQSINRVLWLRQISQKAFMERFCVAPCPLLSEPPQRVSWRLWRGFCSAA